MKHSKLLSLLFLAFLFTFSSCSDDKDDPKPQTKKELLTAKTWKVSKMKGNGLDITNTPDLAELKNTRLSFKSNGTYTMMTTGMSDNGVWEFASAETKLVLDPGTEDEEEFDITELKNNSLKMRTTMIGLDENEELDIILLELEMIYAE